MGSLFNQAELDQINAIAAKSKAVLQPVQQAPKRSASIQAALNESTQAVLEYFKDSPAILITSKEQLHDYITHVIEAGICGIDTETTGTDKVRDTVVGFSLYYPGGTECYIPCKHRTLVETYYKNQLSYEDCHEELQRLVDAKVKLVFANADFDLAFFYKDFGIDFIPIFYYDVQTAWRCLKENEPDNRLKTLYWKYPNKGQGDPKSFSDLFDPKYFPYSKPEVAKLYAANDAKITYELYRWQLPYVTPSHPKCQKHHLEKIAKLVWEIEMPMVRVCALMHRYGLYLDMDTNPVLVKKYHALLDKENKILCDMVQEIMDQSDSLTVSKSPFKTGDQFNKGSDPHVKYLFNTFLNLGLAQTNKETLATVNLPIAKQLLKVRSLSTNINGFVDKMPREAGADGRVHSTFVSVGADTGRMAAKNPNTQNIPSHLIDIRHQFRATPSRMMVDDCTEIVDGVEVTLGTWDCVYKEDNSPIRVKDLNIGDHIILMDNKKEVIGVVKSLSDKAPNTTICFDVI